MIDKMQIMDLKGENFFSDYLYTFQDFENQWQYHQTHQSNCEFFVSKSFILNLICFKKAYNMIENSLTMKS